MNRFLSTLLAGAGLAASAGMALAATAPSSAPPANSASPAAASAAAPAPHKAHRKAMAAASREDKADPGEARMTHALNLLEAKGYGDFSNFKQDGKNFDATVSQNGQRFGVVVDPDANQITRQG